jgi:hypothetical protein
MKTIGISCLLLGAALSALPEIARADEITDWNQFMFQLALAPPATNPLYMTRVAAIVQASVFDAVNGIEKRYTPIHVWPSPPSGASERAAAVQAAYASLLKLYPSQSFGLQLKRSLSLAGVQSAGDSSDSIARGIDWGQKVADGIWAWRSTDGFDPAPPPFLGGSDVGQWRPTPPALVPGLGPQFATMIPWGVSFPFQFRPAGPPKLTSAQYATDFEETKTMGSATSTTRTTDQTLYSRFWNASTASYYWDQIAISLISGRPHTFLDTVRLLAMVNIAMADAAIGCWDGKFTYVFWRPVTAIPLAATDGNDATTADAAWLPLLVTPPHPEYPSGHSCVSGAAGRVLTNSFGDDSPFSVSSDVLLGVTRSFASLTAALDEIKNARVFAGIHFRTACNDGQTIGIGVGDYIVAHSLVSLSPSQPPK